MAREAASYSFLRHEQRFKSPHHLTTVGAGALTVHRSVCTEAIDSALPICRTDSGLRLYSERDLSRLRFIKRAQKMGFSLEEIGQLLSFRDNPQQAKPQVRALARDKLTAIIQHIEELGVLRDELQLLVNLCGASPDGCPILNKLDET